MCGQDLTYSDRVAGRDMKIRKVLNNNVAVVCDAQGKEQVVMGRGLAFQKRAGDRIDSSSVEKVFTLQNPQLTGQLGELLGTIRPEVLAASECIIAMAKQTLQASLHESVIIALTDHLNFAIYRYEHHLPLHTVLKWEIENLYPQEFALGTRALDIIHQRLAIRLAEDEASFIALHLVNAQLHAEMPEVMHITLFMQQILDIVKYTLHITWRTDALSYNRFVTHLKFFAQRMLGKQGVTSDDESLHDVVSQRYPQAYRCVEKIDRHVQKNWHYALGKEERMFLTIHVERVRREMLVADELSAEFKR